MVERKFWFRMVELRLTSLKESVKRSWVDKFGVGIDPTLDWPDKWAEGYIHSLEEHMAQFREDSPDPEDHAGEGAYYFEMIMKEVLGFLRGDKEWANEKV